MANTDVERAYKAELPAPQKAVLVALAFCRNGRTGRCFPSQKELASMTGLSLATVKRSLDVLTQPDGLVSRRKTAKGMYRSNDEYTLHLDRQGLTESPAQTEPRSESQEVGLTQSRSGAQSERAVIPTGTNRKRTGTGARGTRIPEPFMLTADMRRWAADEVPLVDVDRVTRIFVDYWRAQPSSKGLKSDWTATWRNWLRRDDRDNAKRDASRRPTPTERMQATLDLAQPGIIQFPSSPKELTA